jgi:hypothetical protein
MDFHQTKVHSKLTARRWVSEPARSLIDGMMTTNVRLRHSIEEITGCQWFRDEGTLAQLRERIIKDTPIF